MYSASVTRITILVLRQEQLNHFSTTTYKYIPEVNDFKGGYEPEGSGSLSKTQMEKNTN